MSPTTGRGRTAGAQTETNPAEVGGRASAAPSTGVATGRRRSVALMITIARSKTAVWSHAIPNQTVPRESSAPVATEVSSLSDCEEAKSENLPQVPDCVSTRTLRKYIVAWIRASSSGEQASFTAIYPAIKIKTWGSATVRDRWQGLPGRWESGRRGPEPGDDYRRRPWGRSRALFRGSESIVPPGVDSGHRLRLQELRLPVNLLIVESDSQRSLQAFAVFVGPGGAGAPAGLVR